MICISRATKGGNRKYLDGTGKTGYVPAGIKRTLSGYGMYLYAAYHEYWSSYRTGRSGNWPGRCSCGEIKEMKIEE